MEKMSFIEIILLFISFICFYYSYKLKKMLNENHSDEMNKEAKRILFENAENTFNGNYPLDYKVHTKGMALIKDEKTNKYRLIPQIKVCDIGLC